MAVGALFMSLRPGYTSGDLSAYLFGSIVTVTDGDVAALAALTAAVIAGTDIKSARHTVGRLLHGTVSALCMWVLANLL